VTERIWLRRYPVELGRAAAEHVEEWVREFSLIAIGRAAGTTTDDVPDRLIGMVRMLTGRYADELSESERLQEEAAARGEPEVDLSYPVLPEAREVVLSWQQMLAAVDSFCASQDLLTLQRPPEMVALNDWVGEEFLRQLDGHPPRSWPQYCSQQRDGTGGAGAADQSALQVVGEALLLDYPLRLWERQQEHFDSLLREFQLLLVGEQEGSTMHEAPKQLVELADMFTTRFGHLIDSINAERQAALDEGRDRMDSRVPLIDGAPEMMAQVERVMAAVDEFCRSGELLVLPRSDELLALARWVNDEYVKQYRGEGPPEPWGGPF
jgi:hypothetical protein